MPSHVYIGTLVDEDKRRVEVYQKDGTLSALSVPHRPELTNTLLSLECFEWATINNRTLLLAEAILTDALKGSPIPVTKDMAIAFMERHLLNQRPESFQLPSQYVVFWAVDYDLKKSKHDEP